MPSDNRSVRPTTLIAVFCCALAIRLAFCFLIVPKFSLANGPHSEDFWTYTDGYVDLARNLVEHGKFSFTPESARSTFRAPVFPLALAGVFRLVGDMAVSVLVLNCVTSALSAVTAALIAAHFVPRLSLLGVFAPALLPFSIWYCPSSYSDTFLTLTVLLFVLALVKFAREPSLMATLATGSTFALTCLTKAVLLPFPVVLIAWALFRRRSHVLSATFASLLGVALVSIWTVRNYQVCGRFVPISQGMGFNLLAGNYMLEEWADSTASFKHSVKRTLNHLETVTGRSFDQSDIRPDGHFDLPVELDQLCGTLAKQQYADDPMLLAKKLFWNSLRFWYFTVTPQRCALAAAMNFPLIALGLVGLIRWRRSDGSAFRIVMLFILFYVGSYSFIIVSGPRFNLPLLMLLAPFAGQVVARACVAEEDAVREAPATGRVGQPIHERAADPPLGPNDRRAMTESRLRRPSAAS